MMNSGSPKLDYPNSFLLIAVVLLTFSVPSLGQTSTTTSISFANMPYVATMTFDVASVRENKDADRNAGYAISGDFVPHTTILRVTNWTIEMLIRRAYKVDRYQVADVPEWSRSTLFVIEAKGDSEEDTKVATLTPEQQSAEQQHMLQALLAERFKLKLHWEAKEGDVYHLVVTKGGAKLSGEGSMPSTANELKTFGKRPIPPLYQKHDGAGFDFIAHGCTMSEWVAMLAEQFGRPIVDKTGLTGKYDFALKYKGRWDHDRSVDDFDPMPPLDRALQEQLGLKVESAKGPSKVLVIDHIERPSEN